MLLTHNRPINQEMRCGGQKYDLIQKAGRPRRWQTSVSKNPSYWDLDARFFYAREKEAMRN